MNRRIIVVAIAFTLPCLLPHAALAQTAAPPPGQAAWPDVKPDAKKAGMSIAVFSLEAQGVEAKVSNIVSETILSEIGRLPDTKVIGSKDFDAMLGYEQKKQLVGCTEASCATALGGALGVDRILMGSVGKLGESFVVNLKLMDIRKGETEALFTKRLTGGTEEDFLDVLPEALTKLMPWGEETWKSASSGARRSKAGRFDPKLRESMMLWGHVSMWSGLTVAAFGGVSMVLAKSAADDYASGKGGLDAKDSNGLWSTMAITGLSVGAAAMATGAVLWILAPDEPAVKKNVTVGWAPVGGGQGVVVGGAW
jgi:TolB-like protein